MTARRGARRFGRDARGRRPERRSSVELPGSERRAPSIPISPNAPKEPEKARDATRKTSETAKAGSERERQGTQIAIVEWTSDQWVDCSAAGRWRNGPRSGVIPDGGGRHRDLPPPGPEPIRRDDGSAKNDCERNASKRPVGDLRREHPQMKAIVVEDGLWRRTARAPGH